MNTEIEEKFLLSALPAGVTNGVTIVQGYLTTADPEVRVRKAGNSCFLTRKGGEGFIRKEEEVEIPPDAFDILWPLTIGARIEKTRYLMQGADGLIWEVDAYAGSLQGMFTVEVELPRADTIADMPAPIFDVLIVDITENHAFKNKSLAINGRPK